MLKLTFLDTRQWTHEWNELLAQKDKPLVPPKNYRGEGGGGGGAEEPVVSSFAGSPYNTLLIEILCIYLYNKMK